MKIYKLFILLCLGILTSCSSVKVVSDYDTKVDFSTYKTFAFYKKGIDKAKMYVCIYFRCIGFMLNNRVKVPDSL